MVARFSLALVACITPASLVAAAESAIPAEVDKAFSDYIALADTLAPILASAQDKVSADAAADQLFAELPKVYDVRSALHSIQDLPPEAAATIKTKYEAEMRTRWGEVYRHLFRLQKARCYDSIPFFKQFHTLCMMLER